MKKTNRCMAKLLSLVLSAAMLITALPLSASAADPFDETTYTLTGNQRADIVGIAKTQIGYTEGDDADTMGGEECGTGNFVKYAAYCDNYGGSVVDGHTNGDSWCAKFVVWCARKANIPESSGIVNSAIRAAIDNSDRYSMHVTLKKANDYTPQAGDLILFNFNGLSRDDWTGAPSTYAHIGIVENVENNIVYTIEGNSSDEVKNNHYALSTSTIMGYGVPSYTEADATISTNKATYQTGEDIKVSYANTVNEKDWVSIVKKGHTPGETATDSSLGKPYGSALMWAYTGIGSGDVTLNSSSSGVVKDLAMSSLPAGEYTAYLCKNDGYDYYTSTDFTVTAPTTYDVTFDSNGGSDVAKQTITKNEKATKPTDPTKSGFPFDGWYSDSDLKTAFNFDTPITAAITLYAKWVETKDCTITFVSNGGNAISAQTVQTGVIFTITTSQLPTRSGYSFSGWYADSALTSLYNFNNPIYDDVTVYAKWTATSSGGSSSGSSSSGGSSSGSSSSGSTSHSSGSIGSVSSGDTITIPDNTTEKTGFSDTTSHWAKDAINFVVESGYFSGISSTEFAPDTSMTRGMLVSVLYRVAGSPDASATSKFTDVSSSEYYAKAVSWANEKGIVSGLSDDNFGPNASITREQLATILYQYAQAIGKDVSKTGDTSKFSDSAKISAWAEDAIAYAVGANILSGRTDGTLDPKGTATRAEVARVLQVFLG